MSGRRFRDRFDRIEPESDEARLARENILAINEDLHRQISTLRNSTTFRVGRLVLRLLRPVFTLLRIKRFSDRSPRVEIESFWPRLKGTVTIYQPSFELIPVKVTNGGDELLSESIDPATCVDVGTQGPYTCAFEFPYALGFQPFVASRLSTTVGTAEFRPDPDGTLVGGQQLLRPIDVAIDSITQVRGDVDRTRDKLVGCRSMAILSTYRNSDRTAAVPHRLVNALRDEGFALIVVDTSAELPDSDIDCDLLVHRRNIGWDFGSWMSVLARFPWIIDESENVLLINDSNVGPLRPMKELFATGRMLDVDVWGLTDSWDISYHLQSYFLHFNTSALRSGHVESFVHSFTFPTSKERIIGVGELGLTRFMRSMGLTLGALYPYTMLADRFLESVPRRMERVLSLPENQIQADHGLLDRNDEVSFLLDTAERIRNSAPVNPTHYFWDILLELGSPFVKRDLLVKNPDRISGLHRLVSALGDEMDVSALEEEVQSWPRTHPDMSLPLAIHWRPDEH